MGRAEVVNAALASIESYAGQARIISEPEVIDVIPSGAFSVDQLLGCCGYPRGRIAEIFGDESCGKTTAALHLIVEAQKRGHICCFVDAEHAYDASYAKLLGVDIENLLVLEPRTGEDAFAMLDTLLDNGVGVVVVDSVAGLTPGAELESCIDMEANTGQGAMMSKGLRQLSAKVKKRNALVLFTNQVRYSKNDHGDFYKTTPGGNALKFYASIRLNISNIGSIKNDDDLVIGFNASISSFKNKMGVPNRTAVVPIIYNLGFDRLTDLVNVALNLGVIERTGCEEFIYKSAIVATSFESMVLALSSNTDRRDSIAKEVKSKIVYKPESFRPSFNR